MLKLGLDLHGVIDNDPEYFSKLTNIIKGKVEIHIISGGFLAEIKKFCKEHNIYADEYYSIPDYLIFNGADYWYDSKGNFRVDDFVWDTAKGLYCRKNGIDIMVDDTEVYGNFMDKSTFFYLYNKK